jgi:hypothetical protein
MSSISTENNDFLCQTTGGKINVKAPIKLPLIKPQQLLLSEIFQEFQPLWRKKGKKKSAETFMLLYLFDFYLHYKEIERKNVA